MYGLFMELVIQNYKNTYSELITHNHTLQQTLKVLWLSGFAASTNRIVGYCWRALLPISIIRSFSTLSITWSKQAYGKPTDTPKTVGSVITKAICPVKILSIRENFHRNRNLLEKGVKTVTIRPLNSSVHFYKRKTSKNIKNFYFFQAVHYYKRIATKSLNELPQKHTAKHLKNTQCVW